MTPAQIEALEWFGRTTFNSHHMTAIRELLAEPRLSAEPTAEVLGAILLEERYGGHDDAIKCARAIYRRLYAYLLGPVDQLEEIRRYGT